MYPKRESVNQSLALVKYYCYRPRGQMERATVDCVGVGVRECVGQQFNILLH